MRIFHDLYRVMSFILYIISVINKIGHKTNVQKESRYFTCLNTYSCISRIVVIVNSKPVETSYLYFGVYLYVNKSRNQVF